MIQEINSLENLKSFAYSFLEKMEPSKIFLLHGEMGAGKTTLVQFVLNFMGIEELEGSPTYSLVNSYFSEKYGQIYHLDLFRLNSKNEAFDIGIEEIIDGKSYCFIEWPEKIEDLIEDEYVSVNFTILKNEIRRIEMKKHLNG
jgi:tRNA threonylcarbamoyladenosine biosynthesis protein TsaE